MKAQTIATITTRQTDITIIEFILLFDRLRVVDIVSFIVELILDLLRGVDIISVLEIILVVVELSEQSIQSLISVILQKGLNS